MRDEIGRPVTLGARTLIGRSRTCAIRPEPTQVSGEHACVFWREAGWWIRDLGSTNGTWLGGQRLEAGARRPLELGQTIHIGSTGGSPSFTLVDAAPPRLRARHASGAAIEGRGDLLQLPDDETPTWTIFDDGTRWVVEREGVVRDIADHEVLGDADGGWTVELPPRHSTDALDTTEASGPGTLSLELCLLKLRVSPDEEHVEITLAGEGTERRLTPRTFHYVLLTLARQRLTDRRAGLPSTEEGWVYADELARKLASTKPKLNLDICRARQQLAASGITGAGRIVERRATTNQLRIGVAELEIARTATG